LDGKIGAKSVKFSDKSVPSKLSLQALSCFAARGSGLLLCREAADEQALFAMPDIRVKPCRALRGRLETPPEGLEIRQLHGI
jgi:hypothetical protein